jgi:hypothetical protein
MSISKIAAAILIAGGVAAASTAASASEAPTSLNCLKMSKQVKDALDSHQTGAAHENAVAEQRAGVEFCSKGLYQIGINHYEAALKIIGANASASVH